MTFYGKRIEDFFEKSIAGLTVEVRTANGHTDDPARSCLGAAYAATMRNWGGRASARSCGTRRTRPKVAPMG